MLNMNQDNPQYRRSLRNVINLKFIQRFWPEIKAYEYILRSHPDTINLILYSKDDKKYFLKVQTDHWQCIDNLLVFSKYLFYQKLFTPRIVDYKKYYDGQVEVLSHWLLFEYIEKDSKLSSDNFLAVVARLSELHQLKFDLSQLNYPNLAQSNIAVKLAAGNNIIDSDLAKAINVITHSNLSRGLCHCDLHAENLLFSKGNVCIIDLGMMRYDYTFLDYCFFILSLIQNRFDFVYNDALHYFKYVQMDWDKNVFYCGLLVAAAYKTRLSASNDFSQTKHRINDFLNHYV